MSKFSTLMILLFFFSPLATSQAFIKDYACTPVETDARFVDSIHGWDNYLGQTINPAIPIANCAPQGSYKTEIRFLVDRDGLIKGVKAITAQGYGMEAEVIRAIERSPKWIPATRNGRPESWYKGPSFTFVVPSLL
jgi:hypothetical protein